LFIPRDGSLSFLGVNGPTGAAIATLSSSLVGLFGLWLAAKKLTGMRLAIYLGLLFVLKEFKKNDLHFFLDLLRPKEMLNYIKSELKEQKEDIKK
jgi:Na+-driven multidrug efflux pump